MRVWLRFVLSIVLFAVGGAAVADEQRRVLVVLSGVDQVPELPVPTGNYLLEVGVPVMRLRAAGYAVDFVSPDGGPVLVRGNIAYGFADPRIRY